LKRNSARFDEEIDVKKLEQMPTPRSAMMGHLPYQLQAFRLA